MFPLTPVEREGFPPFKSLITMFGDQGSQTIKKYMDGDTPISLAQYLNNVLSNDSVDAELLVGKVDLVLDYVRSLDLSAINRTYKSLLHEYFLLH